MFYTTLYDHSIHIYSHQNLTEMGIVLNIPYSIYSRMIINYWYVLCVTYISYYVCVYILSLYYIILYYIILYYVMLYYIMLYYIVLCYIILYYYYIYIINIYIYYKYIYIYPSYDPCESQMSQPHPCHAACLQPDNPDNPGNPGSPGSPGSQRPWEDDDDQPSGLEIFATSYVCSTKLPADSLDVSWCPRKTPWSN